MLFNPPTSKGPYDRVDQLPGFSILVGDKLINPIVGGFRGPKTKDSY